jgi:hypothetical protein
MAKKISNKYFVKNSASGSFADVTTLFDGVNVLTVEGLDSRGKALNVYYEQWIDGGTDFMITSNNGQIVRENVDIKVVFVVGQRYANTTINTQSVYDSFTDYMTNTDVWVKSSYVGKQVHCVAIEKVEPKTIKLHRGGNTYILGEIQLKCLETPSTTH